MIPMGGKIILGMTGPFGSGCSYIAKEILAKKGYKYISLSTILKKEYGEDKTPTRTELQDFGNKLRAEQGADILARKAYEEITKSEDEKWIVDSIRNTHEIEFLKRAVGTFYVIAAWADQETRWKRVEKKYKRDKVAFEDDDARDSRENFETGQQVTLCYQMADIIIINGKDIKSTGSDDFKALEQKTERFIDIIEGRESFVPSEIETLMAMAYANSVRSSCSQRKVGALIIDDFGNVFSSGYNEVPTSERSCRQEYGMCYRKYLRKQFSDELTEIIRDEETKDKVAAVVKGHFKALDYCRALHAEENAIVNMARLGGTKNLDDATLYTTTYPCNMCANKIAQVGIRHMVYFEPYPQQEAKAILQTHHVEQIPFEGITFNGYFRFMEVLR